MPAPRVIFVNRVYRPDTAATAQLLSELAAGLASRGFAVTVITTGDPSTEPNPAITVHRIGATRRDGGSGARLRDAFRFMLRARSLLRQVVQPGDTVVLMTDPPLLGTALTGAARARGGRVVLWHQDIYPEIAAQHFGGLMRWCAQRLIGPRNRSWRAASANVVLGETMAETMKQPGVSRPTFRLIPNWAPAALEPAALAADRARVRAAWGVDDKFVVVYSGNLGRVHTFAALINAADRLRSEPAVQFVIVGGGPQLAAVQSECQRRGLPNLLFLPAVALAELPAVLAAAEVQLVTLRPEFAPYVYPSKLAGVLAAGRPVAFVGPPEGEIALLLQTEQCGLAFAPHDGPGLARQLRAWRQAPAALAEMGAQARRVYESRFTFDRALAGWVALLHEIGGER